MRRLRLQQEIVRGPFVSVDFGLVVPLAFFGCGRRLLAFSDIRAFAHHDSERRQEQSSRAPAEQERCAR